MTFDDTLVGGHPLLDFLNTVQNQNKERSDSTISDWSSFVLWSKSASLFSPSQIESLEQSEVSLHESVKLVTGIHDLRELIYNALAQVITDNDQNQELTLLEERIKKAWADAKLVRSETNFIWKSTRPNFEWVLDDILFSAECLLRSSEIGRLKQCDRCSWMFINSGRGKGRRWCSMNTCGNRAKSSSHRKRNAAI
ncbi:CGNR zinc finger domain-containing protein [Marinomonas sp.]|uniref:CGNR zinc finger domain-containing protein n=1 Tax=Marinomonas sp. TaxID=1904862 RepID=UPI003BAAEBD7